MMQIFLVGLGAAIASGLLFASIASGAVLSLVLFYLSPLPILIVGLGWSHWAALVAALFASAGLAAAFSSYLFVAFLLGVGLPAWWLSYLTLLARPVKTSAGAVLEWYPIGRIVLWSAILSALVVAAAMSTLGLTDDAIRNELRQGFEAILRRRTSFDLPDPNPRIDALIAAAPPAAAVSVTFINLISLWLAGRIVKVSNRLRRPWPDLTQIAFPSIAPVLFSAAIAGVLLAGLFGILSGILAASLATAYAILGYAVLHALTRGMNMRGFVLSIAYLAIVLGWPVLIMSALGLVDSVVDLRRHVGPKSGPPTTQT